MSLLIAQLSDIHLRPRGRLYKDVTDSNQQFRAAIHHLQTIDRRPDLVVITGDLVDEGHADEYASVLELLKELAMPCLVMPGNHDDRERLRAVMAELRSSADSPASAVGSLLPPPGALLPAPAPLHYVVETFPVRIVAFDACVPGRHHGQASENDLAWLERALTADRTKPTLLLMHHPPFVSGIPYLDQYRYFGEAALAELVRAAPNIEAVLCGHVHRLMTRRWAGTQVLACPSTTTEIALQLQPDASPKSYLGPPACLLHWWTPSHGLVSHLSHIGSFAGPFPFF